MGEISKKKIVLIFLDFTLKVMSLTITLVANELNVDPQSDVVSR